MQYNYLKIFKQVFKTVCVMLVCIIQVTAKDVDLAWVKSMGGYGQDYGVSVATDKEGNVYTTGYFNGKVDFDPGVDSFYLTGDSTLRETRPGSGIFRTQYTSAMYVSKYDAAGNFIWAKKFGGPVGGDRLPKSITLDDLGAIYVTGGFSGEISFDTITLNSSGTSYDVFVVKLDTAGNVRWAQRSENGGNDYGTSVSTDASGNIYITGFYAGTAVFGKDILISNSINGSFWDVFISKLDSAGNFLWSKGVGGDRSDMGMSIVADDSGNVYVTGNFEETVDFDPGTGVSIHTSNGVGDIFILKLNSSGHFIWAKNIGDLGYDGGGGIATDNHGYIYVTGNFMGSVDFDPGSNIYTQTSSGLHDAFILKMDTAANFEWVKTIGGSSSDRGLRLSVDASGNVYTLGGFEGLVDFDPGNDSFNMATLGTQTDLFLLKLGSSGSFVWAKSIPLQSSPSEMGLALNTHGGVHVCFSYSGTVDFDPGPDTVNLTSINRTTDIFVLKLACEPDSSTIEIKNNCEPYTINGNTFSQSGIYTTTMTATHGCDSVITIDLTISVPEAIVTIEVDTLSTTESFASYQWLKDGNPIANATDKNYTVLENGDYQVVVTSEHGCIDTSDVFPVTNRTGIEDVNNIAQFIHVYPNPAHDQLHITSPVSVYSVLITLDGRTMVNMSNTKTISVKDLPMGIYLLKISDTQNRLLKVEKIVRQ